MQRMCVSEAQTHVGLHRGVTHESTSDTVDLLKYQFSTALVVVVVMMEGGEGGG